MAAAFGNRHDNLTVDIHHLLKSQEVIAHGWFKETDAETSGGKGATRLYRTFDMTRDAFTLLVMGWTGATNGAVPCAQRTAVLHLRNPYRTTSATLALLDN